MEKRMTNLEGAFRVGVVLKELLKREGRHLMDIIATGGYVPGKGHVHNVTVLDLMTERYTTLPLMIIPRPHHASAVLDGKLFAIGGETRGRILPSVDCLDLETIEYH